MERQRKVVRTVLCGAVLALLPLLGAKQFQIGQRNFTPAGAAVGGPWLGTNFMITSFTPFSGLRNDAIGIGYEFIAASPNVKAICRYNQAGDAHTHTVTLIDVTTSTILASVSVNAAAGTPGANQCISITPVTLTAGHNVDVMSCEGGGDQWGTDYVTIDPTFGTMPSGGAGATWQSSCPSTTVYITYGAAAYGPVNLAR
jgi:hypothetical protein